jgi:hypothetical protein
MKKILTLLLIVSYSYLSVAQINVGNNQTICLGDTAEVIASLQGGSQGAGMDTVICGVHASNYTSNLTRGFYFQAQSSFIITGLMCATENSGPGYNQSVQFVIFGDSLGGVWNSYPPSTNGVAFSTLFSSIDDTTANYMLCNISIDSGQYYGIIGVRHATGAGAAGQGYNSYSATTGANVIIDGNPTQLNRLYYQNGLAGGVAPIGSFLGATGQIGRIHMLTGGGVNWYDVSTGQMIGSGDTLNYSPTQSTFVAGTITDSTGQLHSDTMRINVSNTQITSSGLSLCNGPIILTAASGFALYVWNNNAASPQMLVTSAGTYYVNCTSSNGSVCQSPPITIYADTIPVTVTPPDTTLVCPGDTIYLQAPLGYSSYLWNTGATAQSILADSTGSYWFYAMDANGCVAASDTAQIVTNELHPDIWSTYATICNNGPVIAFNSVYTDNIYQTYLWGSSSGLTSTFSNMGANNPGNYWVTVTDQFGCSGTSDTLTIFSGNFTFDLLPADSIFLCNAGSSVTLDAANSMNVSTYQWNTGATTQTITTSVPGNYYCIVTTFSGCSGISDTVEVAGINPQLTYSGLSLCAGPISLNTGNYNTYQWSNLAATQSLSVNTAGDYYVFVTDSNGCTAYSDTVSIYTNAFQYSIVPSGSTTICSGYTVDLDAGNQFTGHLWNTGASTSTITASTIGQYYASMTDVNGCSGYTDTVDVTNISVNLTTTGYSLCNPQSYPILNAGTGYYIYNWSTGDTISSITANFPGNYYLSVIDQNGCTADSDTISIYLNQFTFNVNAVGSNFLCQPSGQVTLDAGSGYFQYLWSTGANSQQTTVNATGNYTVTVSDMNGCQGVSNPFTVNNIVLTSTITGLSNVMQNNVETYSVIQNPTSTYNWGVTGGILQSGLGTNSVDVLWNTPGQGSIYVIETDANGCIGDTISLAVTISQSTDIIENPSQQISIYPNPFTKSTIISITNIKSNYSLILYDITGQKVWKEEDLNQRTYELERGALSKGMYFLEIKIEEDKWIRRVVVQ